MLEQADEQRSSTDFQYKNGFGQVETIHFYGTLLLSQKSNLWYELSLMRIWIDIPIHNIIAD